MGSPADWSTKQPAARGACRRRENIARVCGELAEGGLLGKSKERQSDLVDHTDSLVLISY